MVSMADPPAAIDAGEATMLTVGEAGGGVAPVFVTELHPASPTINIRAVRFSNDNKRKVPKEKDRAFIYRSFFDARCTRSWGKEEDYLQRKVECVVSVRKLVSSKTAV
jgi:hypothetical protein